MMVFLHHSIKAPRLQGRLFVYIESTPPMPLDLKRPRVILSGVKRSRRIFCISEMNHVQDPSARAWRRGSGWRGVLGFRKATENDLHSFGQRTVLRSELRGKGSRIKWQKPNFKAEALRVYPYFAFISQLFIRVHTTPSPVFLEAFLISNQSITTGKRP